MFMLGDRTNLYIYVNQDHMMEALRPNNLHTRKMQMAQYVLVLSEDTKTCHVVKDRTGTFNQNNAHPTKKMLKMIQIMLDDD